MPEADDRDKSPFRCGPLVTRGVVLAGLVGLFAALTYCFGDQLDLQSLARQEQALRQFHAEHPLLLFLAAFLIYVVVTSLSLPGAAAMTITIGWLFGFWPGLVLVSLASTTGATLAFLISRYLFGEVVQSRFGQRLEWFNDALRREGPFFLFTLRLIPAAPFFVINAGMGLTPIGVWTFWWVSQLGMLPGTAVFVNAGAAVPQLSQIADQGLGSILSWQLITGLALLGFFPLIARGLLRLARRKPIRPADEA